MVCWTEWAKTWYGHIRGKSVNLLNIIWSRYARKPTVSKSFNAFLQYNTGAAATTFFVNAPASENEQTHSQCVERFSSLAMDDQVTRSFQTNQHDKKIQN